jgi:hypothetical protein
MSFHTETCLRGVAPREFRWCVTDRVAEGLSGGSIPNNCRFPLVGNPDSHDVFAGFVAQLVDDVVHARPDRLEDLVGVLLEPPLLGGVLRDVDRMSGYFLRVLTPKNAKLYRSGTRVYYSDHGSIVVGSDHLFCTKQITAVGIFHDYCWLWPLTKRDNNSNIPLQFEL